MYQDQAVHKKSFYFLSSLFFMWGFITVTNDILINTFKGIFDLTAPQRSLVQSAFFGAFFIVSLIYFLLSTSTGRDPINRIGYKNGMAISLAVCGLGCLMFYPAAQLHSYGFFLAALFVLASGVTLLQICANPYATILGPPETSSSRLNLAQGLNSLGTTLGPLVGTILIYQVFSRGTVDVHAVSDTYVIYGFVFFAMALFTYFRKMPAFKNTEIIEKGLSVLKNKHLALGILAIFFYVGSEVAVGSWIVEFIKSDEIMGLAEEEASYFLSYFWGGLMIGRLLAAVSLNSEYNTTQKAIRMGLYSIATFLLIYVVTALKFEDGIFTFHFLAFNKIGLYLALMLLNYFAFFITFDRPARALVVFSLINAVLISTAILGSGGIAFWALIGSGLFFSVGWSNTFSLAIRGLGKLTSQGSSLLVMAIVGGAVLPNIQSFIIENHGVQISFVVPLIGMMYLIFYGLYGYKNNHKFRLMKTVRHLIQKYCFTSKILFFILSSLFFIFSCEKENTQTETDFTQFVNPFIGTGGHGHTYPGASLPFGMMQLSPDTRLEGWDGCGGYHYSDSIVYGFSHTHLSGTGIPDYGDVLLMPTVGEIQWDNGYKTGVDNGYASRFSHGKEMAKAGFYSVDLLDYNIGVALTVTKRAGLHKYTFPAADTANVMLDLEHRDRLLDADIEIINNTSFQGKRFSKAWAEDQRIYFYGEFSKPFDTSQLHEKNLVELDGDSRNTKAAFSFKTEKDEEILLRIGISSVSIEGAKKNLEAEINHWDFEKTRSDATAAWNEELSAITVKGGTTDEKTIFYTSLYHSLLNPNLFMDVDGSYLGTDFKIHKAEGFTNYTIFSLWDTYRGAHPLYTIIERERTRDFIRTFLNQYKNGGQLPVWELAANYTGCMIGYHSVSVIADAYAKGITDFDTALALEAMKHSANQNHLGLDAYKNEGYIPADHEAESVSKTLEYAYDDWCIAQFAKAIGEEKEHQNFQMRAQFYKNIFDPTEGFMRAKMYNMWFTPFDPGEVNFNYTEANSWQYSFAAQQDIPGMIELYGGAEKFEQKLDQLFETNMELSGRHQVDITGLIGQYAHGNEPSHHIAYLYDYIGKSWKTQQKVKQILTTMYHNAPDGLSGNEDCGQMSAWYVLSAMGFYSVTPGEPFYAIGTPAFEEITIHLENGNTFNIKANNLSEKNFYIQSVNLNGSPLDEAFLQQESILQGGELIFQMGPQPNKNWANNITISGEQTANITPVPFILSDSRTFTDEIEIQIQSVDPESKIYYTLDSSEANEQSFLYEQPITLKESATIKAVALKDGKSSYPIESEFFKIDGSRSIQLFSEYASQYAAGGPNALIDYMTGSNNYRTGTWQGYQAQDLVAVVDMGKVVNPSTISMGFLQDIKSWIWYPRAVKFEISSDGKNFRTVAEVKNDFSDAEYGAFTQKFKTKVAEPFRYVRVTAQNYGKCPDWHLGAGGDTWLFADEIIIK